MDRRTFLKTAGLVVALGFSAPQPEQNRPVSRITPSSVENLSGMAAIAAAWKEYDRVLAVEGPYANAGSERLTNLGLTKTASNFTIHAAALGDCQTLFEWI